ncbi:hypothetical protein BJF79_17795 [Actinomadura sp. CNU-125]|uniref:hypothetical protein n=1 Tax=Actinomadura sp. CNU-125 TaxID=1904961 RepID=UPI00095D3065|nr:hypothetical protein [Actinomadura sp. CNU-125]OLT17406.1 hypothetical protein BJF79_17795 [Actinomadura sp. CNU-125]
MTDRLLRLPGRADHLRVLAAAHPGRLRTGHPLNHPSHILMREIARRPTSAPSASTSPGPDGAALARTVERLRRVDHEPLRRFGIDPATVRHEPGAAVRAARALLPGAEDGEAAGDIVRWAGHASFAVLRTGAVEHRDGRPFAAAHENRRVRPGPPPLRPQRARTPRLRAPARGIEGLLAAARTAPRTFAALEEHGWNLLGDRFPHATAG